MAQILLQSKDANHHYICAVKAFLHNLDFKHTFTQLKYCEAQAVNKDENLSKRIVYL